MARGKTTDRITKLERGLQALELRKRGLSYRAIGNKLGVTVATAHRDVMDELERLAALRDDSVEELRQLELEKLDALEKAVEPMASVGNPAAVASWLRIMERRAKLIGLDMPAKVENNLSGGLVIQWTEALNDDDEIGIGADELE